jgi:hypothetical protein
MSTYAFRSRYITEHPLFNVDVEPMQLRGLRHASGSEIMLPLTITTDSRRCMPLLAYGALVWAPDLRNGLAIPSQPVELGTIGLSIPVSLTQLAAMETRRSGGEPRLSVSLTILAQLGPEQIVRLFQSDREIQYPLSREKWLTTLHDCGYGTIRIVELPSPPAMQGAIWEKASRELEVASRAFANAQYGTTMGATRTSLQAMLGAIELALQITPTTDALGPRAEALEARLRSLHPRRGNDPFAVLAGLLRATIDFCSGPLHDELGLATREDSQLALSTATALYSYAATRQLQSIRGMAAVQSTASQT